MIAKWDKIFLELAKNISTWSKDPSTKVGAVAVGDKRQILATGYNGFPRNIGDYADRLENRETKYKYTIHAEMNCIYNATFNGVSLNGSSLYIYGLPVCSECAKGIIQVGVKRVFMCYPESIPEKWDTAGMHSRQMFYEANVEFFKEKNII